MSLNLLPFKSIRRTIVVPISIREWNVFWYFTSNLPSWIHPLIWMETIPTHVIVYIPLTKFGKDLLEGFLCVAEWAGGRGGPFRDAEGSRVREQHTPARGWRRQQPAARRRREQQHRRGPRLRGLRQGDSRAMVPEGCGPRVALRLSSLLPLPCASRRRVDVLRQGRQHLLQRGLL